MPSREKSPSPAGAVSHALQSLVSAVPHSQEEAAALARLAESLERERIEAGRSQAILNSIADGVIVFDRNWNATLANPAVNGMLDVPLELIVDKIAGDYQGKVKVGKVDTDANRDISIKYSISAIPTVILFKDGQVAQKFVGLRQERDFKEALDAQG